MKELFNITTPTISICIPTYNRATYLENCLNSIKKQLDRNSSLNNVIEIVISDNCSTDNTSIVVKKYSPFFKNYKYVVNKKNLGFDINVLNVVKEATGTYCWTLGDDDMISDGGIAFILDCIKDNNYDLITIGSKSITNSNQISIKKELSKESLIAITDPNDFYFKGYLPGTLSVLIFNRTMWVNCIDTTNYLEWWLYFETILKIAITTHKEKLYVADSVILTGQDCRWAEHGGELYTYINSRILLEKMISFGFDKSKITPYLLSTKNQIFIMLLRAKYRGLKINKKNLLFLYQNNKQFRSISFLLIILFFIPNIFIIIIRNITKKIWKKL